MKIFPRKRHKIPRSFLVAASAYRKAAKGSSGLDFSAERLVEQYRKETFGEEIPEPNRNGYTIGKWMLGVTMSDMRRDLASGDFCKFDLRSGSCAFIRRFVDGLYSPPDGVFFRRCA